LLLSLFPHPGFVRHARCPRFLHRCSCLARCLFVIFPASRQRAAVARLLPPPPPSLLLQDRSDLRHVPLPAVPGCGRFEGGMGEVGIDPLRQRRRSNPPLPLPLGLEDVVGCRRWHVQFEQPCPLLRFVATAAVATAVFGSGRVGGGGTPSAALVISGGCGCALDTADKDAVAVSATANSPPPSQRRLSHRPKWVSSRCLLRTTPLIYLGGWH
jgi:hypothetical protein